MNINLVSNLNCYFIHFPKKIISEVSRRQALIALIAFAALSCLAYCLIYVVRKNKHAGKKADFNTDFSQVKINRNSDPEKDPLTDPDERDGVRYFDQDDSQYDIFTEDLKDKVWQEQNQADYKKEVSNIKILKTRFKQQKGNFKEILQQQYPVFSQPSYNEQVSETLYKALEIREIYKTTHYTFLHARMLDWKIFSYLTKKLIKTFRPDLKINLFEFLRIPFKSHCAQNVSDFMNKYEKDDDNIILDFETFFRQQLVSVDAFWLSKANLESAMDFFLSNSNLSFGIQYACKPLISSCLKQNNLMHKELINLSVKKIKIILNNFRKEIDIFRKEITNQNSSIPGELMVICIPKTMVKNAQTNPCYRAEAMGIPFPNVKEAVQDIDLLEELQQDKIPANRKDIEISSHSNVQYRLITSLLNPKNGIRIFGVDALPKDLKKHYKQPINVLVDEIYAASKR